MRIQFAMVDHGSRIQPTASYKFDVPEEHLLVFPFMYAAKLLINFPADVRPSIVENAISCLSDCPSDTSGAYNKPLLRMCSPSDHDLELLDHGTSLDNPPYHLKEFWRSYEGKLQVNSRDSLVMDTKIAVGDEELLHALAIDIAFEAVRRRLNHCEDPNAIIRIVDFSPKTGDAICFGAAFFFNELRENGCGGDLETNYRICAAAREVAREIQKSELSDE